VDFRRGFYFLQSLFKISWEEKETHEREKSADMEEA
jgi:hypothetical protein